MPSITATKLAEYRKTLHKLSQEKDSLAQGHEKIRAPYTQGSPAAEQAREGLMQLNENLQRTKLRIPSYPKLTYTLRNPKRFKYARIKTPKGHRSLWSQPRRDRPYPLIFDVSVLGGPRHYFELLSLGGALVGSQSSPYFYRLDIRKAYLNIGGTQIIKAFNFLHCKSGTRLSSRRHQEKLQSLERILDTHADSIFQQPLRQQGLPLGVASSKWLSNWVYDAIGLSIKADAVFRFEDDFVALHRQDARVHPGRHWQSHLNTLDEWSVGFAPEKVQSGVLGSDDLTFLGHHLANQSCQVRVSKLAKRLLRTLSWCEAFYARQNALPSMTQITEKHNRFLGYYSHISNKVEVKNYLESQSRRMLRLLFAHQQGMSYSQSCIMLPNSKLHPQGF